LKLSFIFYDTETTGTSTEYDQILQFGAIKTDHNFNEIDRFEIRSRLNPYVIPAPGAVWVTGLTVQQLTDPSLPSHYEMVRAIKEKLDSWSPAIFVGHNSLGFDEYLVRQALYKTLHPPFLTNTNGNCRSDSMRMIQALSLYSPGTLAIPVNNKGKPVFKLDQLAPANGFDHSNAHEAMADVEATIHLCKIIADRAPELWSNFIRFSQKAAVNDFILEEKIFSLSDFYFGVSYTWTVTNIGMNPENSSEIFVFDLSVDPEELLSLNNDDLCARLGGKPKPVRKVRSNAFPMLMSLDDLPEDMRKGTSDRSVLERRAEIIHENNDFSARLIKAQMSTFEQKILSPHVEEQIYDGFTQDFDQKILDQFHEVDWQERITLIDKLSDARLRHLGERLIYTEKPDILSQEKRREFDLEIAHRHMTLDSSAPWLTLPKAIEAANDLLATTDSADTAILRELLDYLNQRSEESGKLVA
jgi:exodeoxyribonuclease-1